MVEFKVLDGGFSTDNLLSQDQAEYSNIDSPSHRLRNIFRIRAKTNSGQDKIVIFSKPVHLALSPGIDVVSRCVSCVSSKHDEVVTSDS